MSVVAERERHRIAATERPGRSFAWSRRGCRGRRAGRASVCLPAGLDRAAALGASVEELPQCRRRFRRSCQLRRLFRQSDPRRLALQQRVHRRPVDGDS